MGIRLLQAALAVAGAHLALCRLEVGEGLLAHLQLRVHETGRVDRIGGVGGLHRGLVGVLAGPDRPQREADRRLAALDLLGRLGIADRELAALLLGTARAALGGAGTEAERAATDLGLDGLGRRQTERAEVVAVDEVGGLLAAVLAVEVLLVHGVARGGAGARDVVLHVELLAAVDPTAEGRVAQAAASRRARPRC
ncbi:MAG: hypothetical protein IPK74_34230 [Deltaproteobacteria bacterium]|nr:hypothetical protein [Deltaproteobacteria bacterium]